MTGHGATGAWHWPLVAALAAITLQAAWVRFPGLDPPSLWYDDVWVAALISTVSPVSLFSYPTAAPVGFLQAQWAMARLVGDPELGLQLLPFLVGLVVIPLAGMLGARISGRPWLGILAAVILAQNPILAEYSLYAKHYSLDVLATSVLLLLAAPLLEAGRRIDVTLLASLAVIGLGLWFFSFTSVLTSAVLVHMGALLAVATPATDRRTRIRCLAIVILFDLGLLATYGLYLRHASNSEITEFWASYFLPVDGLVPAARFLATTGYSAVAGALPGNLAWMGPLVFVGLAWLFWRPPTRRWACGLTLIYVGWLTASVLRQYPLGGGRTDLFSFPVTIGLVCTGIGVILAWLPARGRTLPVVVAGISAFALLSAPRVGYRPTTGDTEIVRELVDRATSADALVLYTRGGYFLGYYGQWGASARPEPGIAEGFAIELARPRSLTLPADSPEVAALALFDFLASVNAPRVFVVVHARPRAALPDRYVRTTLQHFGYERRDTFGTRNITGFAYRAERAPAPTVLPLRIDLGVEGDDRYLGSGWSRRESASRYDFRWAETRTSYLIVPTGRLARAPGDARFTLRFAAHPLAPAGTSQSVRLFINGDALASVELKDGYNLYEVALPGEYLERGMLILRFRHAFAVTPRSMTGSGDTRRLAARIDYVEISQGTP